MIRSKIGVDIQVPTGLLKICRSVRENFKENVIEMKDTL